MVLGLIEYLEHYNERSPYINREAYIRKYKSNIEHALKEEGQEW